MTDNVELKWTRQTMSPVLVRQGVDAAVVVTGGRGEGTLLAIMVVLLVKWPKWAKITLRSQASRGPGQRSSFVSASYRCKITHFGIKSGPREVISGPVSAPL